MLSEITSGGVERDREWGCGTRYGVGVLSEITSGGVERDREWGCGAR